MAIDVIGLALAKSYTASSLEGAGALVGDPGKSAYEIDVSNGFTGTEAEWLESIKGDKGDAGTVPHIDDTTRRWFIGDQDTGYVAVPNTNVSFNDLSDVPTIPVAVSQLTNDENFIKRTVDNLINYHPKTNLYTKEEVNNLISNINRLTTSIVNELPTIDISTTTIYLIAAEGSVYNQYMYIDGKWANLGNTSVNLEGYITTAQLQLALKDKSDENHTHEELHIHGNYPLLETISAEMIQKWNSKFSGNYNDLTGLPNIPTVTNDLTDELKEEYDDAVLKKHTHLNPSVLDKFSEDANGKPLYNGKAIQSSGGSGSGTVQSVNNVFPDSNSNVELVAADLDTYNKLQIDDKIENFLNIQYINATINTPIVKSGKEIFSKNDYPIANKNMVIYEDNSIIKFIVTVDENIILKRIYIRTMNKATHEYTDQDTGNTYSSATNNVGYYMIFADETYCYLRKTENTSNGTISANFYRLNYIISGSAIESRTNFPKNAWNSMAFIKINTILYGFGGGEDWSATKNWNSIWKYDVNNNIWTVLSATLPQVCSYPYLTYSKLDNKIYSTFGFYTNYNSTWSQKYAWCFDVATETVISLPNRSVNALSGIQLVTDIGYVVIPLYYQAGTNYTWGELGSQIYIPQINKWVDFATGLPLKTGLSYNNTLDASALKIIEINNNTIHLTVDGESNFLTIDFALLGIYAKDETIYITSHVKSNKDVKDSNGSIILAGTAINPNTEIKILEDDTRLQLMTSITANGS